MKIAPLVVLCIITLFYSCRGSKEKYVCDPCNLPCDTLVFDKPGSCPHCNMKLIKQSELIPEPKLEINQVDLSIGSGFFLVEGGKGRKEKTIKVFYHKPEAYSKDSKILFVIPGAGRNGDSYRDAWVEESEKYSVLILSPMYAEKDYPFEDYHLCGLMQESNIRDAVEFVENTNIANLNEEKFTYQLNTERGDWLFNDFDRIFDLVVNSTASSQTQYDLFGHSAGGQILHRLAIFSPHVKANRIVSSNSGFYTLPDFDMKMPFGLKGTPINTNDLKFSFAKKLILLIGELDNEKETGGTLLRSPTVDGQGLHRLARGQYFYEFSENIADDMELEFNWELEVVLDVGHNHRKMGDSAAKLLYEVQ